MTTMKMPNPLKPLLLAAGLVLALPCTAGTSQIAARPYLNDNDLRNGMTLWFNASLRLRGLPRYRAATICITEQVLTIRNGANNVETIHIPDAVLSVKPWNAYATAGFEGGRWQTSIPADGAAVDAFMSGISVPMPAGVTKAMTVTWKARFESDNTGVTVMWHTSAAPYKLFTDDYEHIQVQATDRPGNELAGSPTNFKRYASSSGAPYGYPLPYRYVGSPSASTSVVAEQTGRCGGLY